MLLHDGEEKTASFAICMADGNFDLLFRIINGDYCFPLCKWWHNVQ